MATKDEDAITELFVTSTHTPVLFFSTAGKVYRLKVWRLPEGGPATRGRPMVNLLPLGPGETISTVLPLPEDEEEWGKLHVMFATAMGSVRRNSMDAFANVPSNGKIAMKFEGEDEDDRLIGVALLDESDDVLLATRTDADLTAAANVGSGGAIAGAVIADRMGNSGSRAAPPPPPGPQYVEQPCRRVETSRDVVKGYTVVYRYHGRDATTTLPYNPGDRITVGVNAIPEAR